MYRVLHAPQAGESQEKKEGESERMASGMAKRSEKRKRERGPQERNVNPSNEVR